MGNTPIPSTHRRVAKKKTILPYELLHRLAAGVVLLGFYPMIRPVPSAKYASKMKNLQEIESYSLCVTVLRRVPLAGQIESLQKKSVNHHSQATRRTHRHMAPAVLSHVRQLGQEQRPVAYPDLALARGTSADLPACDGRRGDAEGEFLISSQAEPKTLVGSTQARRQK